MFKLMGYEEKKGEFTDKSTGEVKTYHNYDLHYVTDEKDGVKGFFCDSARAKAADLQLKGCKTLDDALNKEVYLIADLTAKVDEEGKSRMMIKTIVCLVAV